MSIQSASQLMLTEEERAFQQTVRKFMLKEVVPLVPQMEKEGRPTEGLLKKMGDADLLGVGFPEEYGGSGGTLMARAIVAEETARVCAGLDATIFVNISLVAKHLLRYGSEEQKKRYLTPLLKGEISASICLTEPHGGSDALSPKTRAVRDGDDWVIKGHKIFITNSPIAKVMLVFTRTSGEDRRAKGGTAFLVETDAPGLTIGKPLDKLCLRSSPTAEVFFDNVRARNDAILGKEGEGFLIMLAGLDVERVFEGTSVVGIAQGAMDIAAPYAMQRKVFGKNLSEYQMMQDKIAKMAAGIEIARTMTYHLIRACEQGINITKEVSMLKLYGSEMAVEATRDAVQILGGYGLMEEYQVARYYRDAKHHEIGAGTSEIMKLIISKETFKAYQQ